MWHMLIGCCCIIFTCVENCIKYFLVGHIYIVRYDSINEPGKNLFLNMPLVSRAITRDVIFNRVTLNPLCDSLSRGH
jgi:hypothetical protein